MSVDVGGGKAIKIPHGQLKIGLFLQTTATAFNQSFLKGAQEEAAKYGYSVEAVDGQFNLAKQADQIQTAATTVAGDTTYTYTKAFFDNAIKEFPGAQKVALVTGPELDPLVINQKKAIQQLAQTNPDFKVNIVYTDWTTATALSATRNYLNANHDVTLVLSAFSPDLSRAVVTARTSVGMLGKVGLADQGATAYSVEQVKNGTMKFTLPYFPDEYGRQFIDAAHSAQMGQSGAADSSRTSLLCSEQSMIRSSSPSRTQTRSPRATDLAALEPDDARLQRSSRLEILRLRYQQSI